MAKIKRAICKSKIRKGNIVSFPFLIAILLFFLFTVGDVLGIEDKKEHYFTVITPDAATAGESFAAKIIAKDEFSIVITDYNEVGGDVEITTTGSGTISPTLVAASEFKDGIATVDFVYDKAESFTIIVEERVGSEKKEEVEVVREIDLRERLENHYKVGKRHYRQRDYTKAVKEFEEVIGLDANYKDADRYLVRCHQAMVQERLKAEIQAKKQAQEKTRREERKDERAAGVSAREYTIGQGDVLYISVWQEEDLSQEVAVLRPDGKISFPLAGDVSAVGLTFAQLKEELIQRLKKYIKYPVISISLRRLGGKKVIILGEVGKAGVYSVTGKSTILEAVALAGGFTPNAVPSSTILIRGGFQNPKGRRLNLTRAIDRADMSQNVVLQPEDVVYIPKKFIANVNYALTQILGPLSKGTAFVRDIRYLED